jgi:hypothetical protein
MMKEGTGIEELNGNLEDERDDDIGLDMSNQPIDNSIIVS